MAQTAPVSGEPASDIGRDLRATSIQAFREVRGETERRDAPSSKLRDVLRILEIGLNHEQQHQELILTDILHALAENPDCPTYDAAWRLAPTGTKDTRGFADVPEGIRTIGHQDKGFCFDN